MSGITVSVVTGASRGLGAALARAISGPSSRLVLIARSVPDLNSVQKDCENRGATVKAVTADLGDPVVAAALIASALADVPWAMVQSATLYNNASQIGPIRRLEELQAEEIDRVVRVNLTGSIAITAQFLRHVKEHPKLRAEVLNISTGVSIRPLAGWSLYCSSKAGLNLVNMSIAEETKDWPNPVRTVAVNPGPVDTEMQREIRASSPSQFPDIERFRQLHANGKLATAEAAARKVLALRDRDPFPQGQFVDLKDL